jgi:hypothetical protein
MVRSWPGDRIICAVALDSRQQGVRSLQQSASFVLCGPSRQCRLFLLRLETNRPLEPSFCGWRPCRGFPAAHWGGSQSVAISEQTRLALTKLGIYDFSGLAPRQVFTWSALPTLKGFVSIVVGGFLVGFGTAYAGGCTSGHAISGLADMQLSSFIAVLGFFAGGLIATHFLLPLFL